MVSKAKLFTQLDILERELEEKLIPHLENSAAGNNDLIFCVTDFNSYKQLKTKTDKTTEHLVEIGAQILVLKNKLNESSAGSIAEKFAGTAESGAIPVFIKKVVANH